jgi:hypothetical protein
MTDLLGTVDRRIARALREQAADLEQSRLEAARLAAWTQRLRAELAAANRGRAPEQSRT